VSGPESVESACRECDDAEPTTPDAEDLEAFERSRMGYGIGE
jgi:hypothetical protein